MQLTVGLILGSKQKQWLPALASVAKEWGKEKGVKVHVKGVDMGGTVDEMERERYDVILHKLCSHIALEHRDAQKAKELAVIEQYFAAHPHVAFDSLQAIRDVNDRHVVAQKLDGLNVRWGEQRVAQPPFFAASSRQDAIDLQSTVDFSLPWVCKPFVADGVPESHNLGMIVRAEGLLEAPLPYIVQPFVNHDAQIIKVYVLGDLIVQLRRPSLPNTTAEISARDANGAGYVPFGRISNAGANGAGEECKVLPEDEKNVPPPTEELLRELAKEVKCRLELQVFGMDLIRDSSTGDYLLIDINYLPGYYGVPNVFESLLELLNAHVQKNRK